MLFQPRGLIKTWEMFWRGFHSAPISISSSCILDCTTCSHNIYIFIIIRVGLHFFLFPAWHLQCEATRDTWNFCSHSFFILSPAFLHLHFSSYTKFKFLGTWNHEITSASARFSSLSKMSIKMNQVSINKMLNKFRLNFRKFSLFNRTNSYFKEGKLTTDYSYGEIWARRWMKIQIYCAHPRTINLKWTNVLPYLIFVSLPIFSSFAADDRIF